MDAAGPKAASPLFALPDPINTVVLMLATSRKPSMLAGDFVGCPLGLKKG